ncbi:hypothetical protein PFNF135_06253 [Plasmodium falciparum NF135/5.C10]|uniref:Plasmodium RESA N-terminal domain-containing protein n=1 Tax=Plasmodium falciparum NF135/5.C10 TaxID=1036726 RepID=W4I7F8_PLAFA|nr:hypothetical protein PFNF135_06253 [Plasmodium falciparum NF135/5.C10]
MMEKKVYVNLDDQYIDEDIIKTENMLFKIPEAIGGYTFINYIENLYEGIHVYKKEEINISHLWRNLHKEYLKIRKELTSFEEYIYNQKKEKNKQSKKDKYKKLQECVSTYNSFHDKIKDDEDERFEYFKKLKNQNERCEENVELKDQINSVYNNMDIGII